MSTYPTRITNPEALRDAAPDLRDGIPAGLWNGADQRTRAWLLDEAGRQRADAARQSEATVAERQDKLRRILARPVAHDPAAQLRRLQQLLFEAAAAAGTLANAMPATKDTPTDAPASLTKESTP